MINSKWVTEPLEKEIEQLKIELAQSKINEIEYYRKANLYWQELVQYRQYTETPLAQEYKTKLEEIRNNLGPLDFSATDEAFRWLINRVEQGDFYHAHAEYQISILNKVKEFAKTNLEYQSTIDYPGGYAQALRDLKELLK